MRRHKDAQATNNQKVNIRYLDKLTPPLA